MSKQTAAEKFDKVPPWCVVKPGDTPSWGTYSHDLSRFAMNGGHWGTGKVTGTGLWDSEPEARRIARLTRPLPSWEPAPDCALPVGGWYIKAHTATSVGLYDANGMHPTGADRLFPSRRAAYEWAWTEAPAPEERKPITEADVKVGQSYRSSNDGVRTFQSLNPLRYTYNGHEQGGGVTLEMVVGVMNADGSRLITDGTGATDGQDELTMVADRVRLVEGEAKALADRVGKVEGVLARIGSMESFVVEAQALANRLTIVERLVAAQVPVPAKVNVRSDAASTVEAMTEAAASDDTTVLDPCDDYERAMEAVPPTYRVGDDLAAWVRNLASAHDTALTVARTLRTQLADAQDACVRNANAAATQQTEASGLRHQLAAAQAATVAAEGRAETARRHAADAEAKLSALRADIENVRASLGK